MDEVIYMKRLRTAAVLGMILAILLGDFADFRERLETVHSSVLRLHILANSDSDEDQARKLLVRDALLRHSEELFAGCDTLEEMRDRALEERETIRLIAQAALEETGCDDPVTVQLAQMEFDTREYEELTMPGGEYEALRILIGKGEGHNWWCVMYPPLCISEGIGVLPKQSEDKLKAVLTDEEYDMITDGGVNVKFRIAEILGKYFR